MARSAGTVIQNTFTKGLFTEATGLNFPENAATDADNVYFEPKGTVRRRKGIDLEGSATTLTYEVSDGVVKEFVWQAVGLTGGFTFLVLQKGSVVHFFELDEGDSLSLGIAPTSVSLSDYKSPEAPELKDIPCSFASGAGYLFIAHPFCDPIIIRYIRETTSFEAQRVTVRIRDYTGTPDNLGISENPLTLSDAHHYNLKNQGWDQQVRVGNVTNEVGAGGTLSPTPPSSRPTATWVTIE